MIRMAIFCQIVYADVGRDKCQALQRDNAPAACKGCGSPCRLCSECRKRPLVKSSDPGCLDVCRQCLDKLLAEDGPGTPACDDCKVRQVRYPSYGWCLTCAARSLLSPADRPSAIDKLRQFQTTPGKADAKPQPTKEQDVGRPKKPEEDKQRELETARALVEEAGADNVSAGAIQRKLGISWPRARELADELGLPRRRKGGAGGARKVQDSPAAARPAKPKPVRRQEKSPVADLVPVGRHLAGSAAMDMALLTQLVDLDRLHAVRADLRRRLDQLDEIAERLRAG